MFPNIQVISGFFAIIGALINWILISVLLFFGGRLFFNGKGVFRNFFKIIGLCNLVLLVTTFGHFIFILLSMPPDLTTLAHTATNSQEPAEATIEALASVQLPVQLINIIGHICFALTLVAVVQTFFQMRWVQAFCNTCIFYAIYWALSKALWSVFSYVFFFFFQQFFCSELAAKRPDFTITLMRYQLFRVCKTSVVNFVVLNRDKIYFVVFNPPNKSKSTVSSAYALARV